MPKAMRPRPGPTGGHRPSKRSGLPKDVLTELHHMSRPNKADAAIARLERAVQLLDRAGPLAEETRAAKGVPIAAKAEAVIVAASALADQAKFDQALGMLRRIRTRDDVASPEVLRVWYVMGDILERSGHPQEAQREFSKIVRHDPSAFDAAERAAQLG